MSSPTDPSHFVCNVAIVDDEACVREALTSLLRSAGYETAESSSAEEFLALNDHDRFACLILDLHLPGMDGLELQEWLAQFSRHIPIVFVSADGLPASRERALSAGAIAFLKKPFDDETLLAGVRTAIASLPNG